jgi:hypothetical protein
MKKSVGRSFDCSGRGTLSIIPSKHGTYNNTIESAETIGMMKVIMSRPASDSLQRETKLMRESKQRGWTGHCKSDSVNIRDYLDYSSRPRGLHQHAPKKSERSLDVRNWK